MASFVSDEMAARMGGALQSLGQQNHPMMGFATGLAGLVNQYDTNLRDQQFADIFAANPDFAAKLFGAKNDQALLGIQKQRLAQEQQDMMLKRQRAQQLGFPTDAPSAIQEYLFFSNLPDEDKQKYLNVKRSNQVVNLGGTQAIVDPTGQISQQYTVTPKITDTPSYQAAQTGAQEAARQGVRMQTEPVLAQANAAAGERGKELGTAEAKLASMEANLPNLRTMVQDLSQLGKTATYTGLGRAKDTIIRESGGKVPQGAIDREAYITKVDNEVLPLLRQTFGAAFTVQEGESLRATLGDPNKSPEEKDARLKSFIESKEAEIKSLRRQTGNEPSRPTTLTVKPSEGMMIRNPTTGAVKFWRNGQWVDQ